MCITLKSEVRYYEINNNMCSNNLFVICYHFGLSFSKQENTELKSMMEPAAGERWHLSSVFGIFQQCLPFL